jgi:hypothetical protein
MMVRDTVSNRSTTAMTAAGSAGAPELIHRTFEPPTSADSYSQRWDATSQRRDLLCDVGAGALIPPLAACRRLEERSAAERSSWSSSRAIS